MSGHLIKRVLFFCVGLMITLSSAAQVQSDTNRLMSNKVYDTIICVIDNIDEKPIFPGCEALMGKEQELCFEQKIFQHLVNACNITDSTVTDEVGCGKVYVVFIIDENGRVVNPKVVRGVNKMLDAEAIRMVKTLPTFIPAKQNGKPVKMRYSVPIVFKTQY